MNQKNTGFIVWALVIIAGLCVILAWQTQRYTEVARKWQEYTPTWKYGQVDLMFNSRLDSKEANISEDLKRYVGWIFISEELGAVHITGTFSGYKNCICIKGDPRSRPARKIYATIISQETLKENFNLEWRDD